MRIKVIKRDLRPRIFAVLMLACLLLSVLPLATSAADASAAPMRYGRELLSRQSNGNNMTAVYDMVVSAVSEVKQDADLRNTAYTINETELSLIYEAVLADYPEFIHLDSTYSYSRKSTTGEIMRIYLMYTMTADEYATAKQKLEDEVARLTEGLSGLADYEKTLILHDRLALKVTYRSSKNDQTAYGSLVEGAAVCAGYARGYQLLLTSVGIPVWYVTGEATDAATGQSVGHAWNIVKLGGGYCYTDVTWDDQGDTADRIYYSNFNMSEKYFLDDHKVETTGLYAYYDLHANAEGGSYFDKNGGFFAAYDRGRVAKVVLASDDQKCRCFVTGDVSGFLEAFKNDISALVREIGFVGSISYSWSVLGREVILVFSGTIYRPPVTETTTEAATTEVTTEEVTTVVTTEEVTTEVTTEATTEAKTEETTEKTPDTTVAPETSETTVEPDESSSADGTAESTADGTDSDAADTGFGTVELGSGELEGDISTFDRESDDAIAEVTTGDIIGIEDVIDALGGCGSSLALAMTLPMLLALSGIILRKKD